MDTDNSVVIAGRSGGEREAGGYRGAKWCWKEI